MKLAHLILAHCQPEQLRRLVTKLAHGGAHFYVHVDKKTDISPFLSLTEIPNLVFIKNRIKVYWGGYSMVQATLNSFEEIIATGAAYDYVNLLSGQDYPIKSTAYIHQFLSDNPGKIFMNYLSVDKDWQEAIPRITRYHFINYNLPGGTYRLERMINSLLPQRELPVGIDAVGRSQWFTMVPEAMTYILQYMKHHKWIVRFFKLSWAPDEMIFQTILYNSDLREKMVNNNLLYVDWSAGLPSPKILSMEDAPALLKSDKLFARKVNPDQDAAIIDYLDGVTG
jgi:truncated hemoglobin YjbI